MKRYKVEMQREGSVKYFFIRDMETLEIVLLPSCKMAKDIKDVQHFIRNRKGVEYYL